MVGIWSGSDIQPITDLALGRRAFECYAKECERSILAMIARLGESGSPWSDLTVIASLRADMNEARKYLGKPPL